MTGKTTKVRKIQIILKAVERCNLTCSYCYYFFGGDESYKDRPPLINYSVIDKLIVFLNEAADTYDIDILNIVFHGGEPMMLPVNRFAKICEKLTRGINKSSKLALGIQTNATLFNEEWVEVLDHYGVAIGISVDGTQEFHDKYRIDKHGNPSYHKVKAGISLIKEKAGNSLFPGMGLINVFNPEMDYGEFLTEFHNDLGINEISFLLLDCDQETGLPDGITAGQTGEALCQLFDEAVQRPQLKIRHVNELLDCFQKVRVVNKQDTSTDIEPQYEQVIKNVIVVVHSNGEISIDDTLMPAASWYTKQPKLNLSQHSFTDFISQPVMRDIQYAHYKLPDGCLDCKWKSICGGGVIENRYSKERGFDNPSVYCQSLQMFYSHVVEVLVANGYPEEEINRRLVGYKRLGEDWFRA